MRSLHIKAGLTALLIVVALLANFTGAVQAAAPKCKPSVGTSNRHVCTTDFTAKPSTTTTRAIRFHAIKPRFKVKTVPCYKSPVPGCR